MSVRFHRRQGMGAYLMGHASPRAVGGGNAPNVPATIVKPAGEPIHAGQLVSLDDSTISGTATAWLAQADGLVHRQNPVGYAKNTVLTGGSVVIVVAGQQTVGNAYWDTTFPGTADAGALVFMSNTPGNSTLTAPLYYPSVVEKVGIVGVGGTGAGAVIVQIGNGVESTVLEDGAFATAQIWFNAANTDGLHNAGFVSGQAPPATWTNVGTAGGSIPLTVYTSGSYQAAPFPYLVTTSAGDSEIKYTGPFVTSFGFLPMKVCVICMANDGSVEGRFAFGCGLDSGALNSLKLSTDVKYVVNGGYDNVTPPCPSGVWERIIYEWPVAGVDTVFVDVSGTLSSGLSFYRTGNAVAFGMMNAPSAFGDGRMHGGMAMVALWTGAYPTNAQIDATLLAQGYPSFPF